ncbi:hypothetical protein JCM10914A_32630 [Paenibacillus sp. JCM 10914]|uniref:hypothetical protein n=1 Tax=Paenibacillus sp. JCM 10914 TaxID=1236974 RepID=UPI000566C32D|nr:hypothetical protein [Paenibacillus sp. JCM 10914]
MKLKISAARKVRSTRVVGSKKVTSYVRRNKLVQGRKRRSLGSYALRKRRGLRRRYSLRRGGRVFYPASSQAYSQGYNQSYDEGFKAGFAKGYEDGQTPPAPPAPPAGV